MSTGLAEQFRITGRVITSLILRESKTRFGRSKFGYFWALIEPVAFVGIFIVIRTAIGDSVPFGESMVLFIITGLLTARVFQSLSGWILPAIAANQALLAYPPVKPNDVMLSRFVLETLTMYTVVTIFYLLLSLVVENKIIYNFNDFMAAIAAVTLLGCGVGVFNAVFSVLFPTWGNFWKIISFPIFILSGIFYLPKQLPPLAQDILWWNPVLHCVEWMRTGTYLTYDPLLSKPYVLAFGAGSLALGLALERIYRFRLLSA